MQKVYPGEIPLEIQILIMAKVMNAFMDAVNRHETNELATERASATAEAGVQAWKVLNGASEDA